jgi:hypothetical protein
MLLALAIFIVMTPSCFAAEPRSIDTVLTWLPAGTEEISCLNAAHLIPKKIDQSMMNSTMNYLFMSLVGPVFMFDKSVDAGLQPGNPLCEKTLTSAVHGTQLLRWPGPRNSTNRYWHGVTILTFKESVRPEMIAYLKTQAVAQIPGGDDPIWKSAAKVNYMYSCMYGFLSMPDDRTIMISLSNDQKLLLESLQRFQGKGTCIVPASHPAWRYVNRQSDYWFMAVLPSKYPPESSECNDAFAAQAAAMVAQYNPQKSKILQMAYIARNGNALALLKKRLSTNLMAQTNHVTIKGLTAEAAEMDLNPLGDAQADIMTLLGMLQGTLCHEVQP